MRFGQHFQALVLFGFVIGCQYLHHERDVPNRVFARVGTSDAVRRFMRDFVPSFSLTLDELN